MVRVLATCALVLGLAIAARAQDQIDLSTALLVNAPDVSAWPATATITRLTFTGFETSVEFTKQYSPDRWPDVVPPGWDGPLQYTLWLFVKNGDQWAGSGFIQFWYGRTGSGSTGDPDVPSLFDQHWYYAARWRPINGHGPIRPGEPIGFMVTSGNARDSAGPFGPMERSNVVVVAASDKADYTFSATPPPVRPPPPIVVPPPVVVVPPPAPPVVVAPPPPVIVPPPPPVIVAIDYTEQLRQILAAQQAQLALEQDTNRQITQLNKSFADTIGRAMAFIGKYIAPAVGAWIAAKKL